jgi:adenosylcobinamide-GDP ribazoletransferase
MRGLLVAGGFLTRLPIPAGPDAGDLGRAAGWFPVVGVVLGALLAAGHAAAGWLAPPLLAAVLVVALWAFLTGGLHLDGLADAADGLGGGWSRDETLAIMRDARTGAYGVVAIALVLALKMGALAGLAPALGWRALLVAPVLARAAPVGLARLCPPARAEGAGHAFAMTVAPGAIVAAALVPAGLAVSLFGAPGLAPVAVTALATLGFAGYLRRRLGGLTGDCLGALVEASEALTLIALAALAHRGLL